jgi:hypothetical protein
MTTQLRLTEEALRSFLEGVDDNPPPLCSFFCERSAETGQGFFTATFTDGRYQSWNVDGHELRGERDLPPGVVEGVYDHLRREHVRRRQDVVEVGLNQGWAVIEPGPVHLLTPEEHDRLQRELIASMAILRGARAVTPRNSRNSRNTCVAPSEWLAAAAL